MSKKNMVIVLIFVFAVFFLHVREPLAREEPRKLIVGGLVQDIANDDSYVIISGRKIFTSEKFREVTFFEIGENIEIIAEISENGLEAVEYKYLFEEVDPYEEEIDPSFEKVLFEWEEQEQKDLYGLETGRSEAGVLRGEITGFYEDKEELTDEEKVPGREVRPFKKQGEFF